MSPTLLLVDPATMRQRVVQARVARLATVDGAGRPSAVPVCFALDDGDRLYSIVDAKPKTTTALARLDHVRARPDVLVLVDHYEEDWRNLWWVRLRGRARVVEEGEEHERARALLAAKYPQYRAELPGGPVLAVEVLRWQAWDGAGRVI